MSDDAKKGELAITKQKLADCRAECDQLATNLRLVQAAYADAVNARSRRADLLKRYLDNHCANADAEGMSALCECKLCLDTRVEVFG